MEKRTKEVSDLQWHPACYAGMQIEFLVDRMKMFFENEHQLGTKPKEIDILIIKKNSEEPLEKNIGRIFRKHNLVEYKSPTDYLSIDDFYKVYAYACLYKIDTPHEDEIKVQEITISFISKSYPRKMAEHLQRVRNFEIVPIDAGIYYIIGDVFPMQLIVTSELSKEKNFWLRNLTNDIEDPEEAAEIVREYKKHHDNKLYQSVMDIIVRANEESFDKEEIGMCQALWDIYKDTFNEKLQLAVQDATREIKQQMMQQVTQEVTQQVTQEVTQQVTSRVRQEGIQSMIEACKSLGASWERVLIILTEKFTLEKEQAEEYMCLYW